MNSKRLSPTAETIKMLLLRSGNECYFPNCTERIFNDDDILIAECCHIEAALPGGERYNQNQTPEERRSIENLLFLCHKHHKETDDVEKFTVEKLKGIKATHEERFKETKININPNHVSEVLTFFQNLFISINENIKISKNINEKQDEILDILKSKNIADPKDLINEYFGIPLTQNFYGRIGENIDLNSNFNKFNTFIIGGISGVGKSSFIANFLSNIPNYEILWVNSDITDSQELFFDYFARFIKQTFQDNSIERVLSSSDYNFIIRTIISCLNKYSCCIIFDGLGSIENDFNSLLKSLNDNVSSSKIIITTLSSWNIASFKNPIYQVELRGIDKDSYLKLFQTYDIKNVDSDSFNKIHQLLNGHPYLLKLCISIIQYQPVESFLTQLTGKKIEEVSSYIKSTVLNTLDYNEYELLKLLSIFEIPFRYEIGKYIGLDTFDKLFRNLRNKFLIEPFHNFFFVIPEFVKREMLVDKNNIDKLIYTEFINYLLSVKSDITNLETNALIYFALNANNIALAKKEAENFISYLMNSGKFNYASKISTDLLNESRLDNWGILYYIRGRIARFQGDFETALKNYNCSLNFLSSVDEKEKAEYEKATMQVYLSDKSKDYLQDAILIYNRLILSNNSSLSIQSHSALAKLLLNKKEYDNAIDALLKTIELFDDSIEPNVKAQVWQLLGDAYSKTKDYQRAFESYDESIDYYRIAIDKFGMNVIDGLYNLYNSYGWTYSKCEDYSGSTEMFGICVDLCENFELGRNKERALFDYGYHLILDNKHENAIGILAKHYKIIIEEKLIEESDMPLIHGVLSFANWYSGNYEDAIHLLALYLNSCYVRDINPMVILIEEDGMSEKLEPIKYMKKRMYIYIIPSGKSFSDFKEWSETVCTTRPELTEILNSFMAFTHK
ncbi:tetratricopeptide repeat protein [Dysgonomonas sp. HDW5B]|uniref:tetratricopeptide repeat protein n=1 Tax=Dysgonomonas sp. HDW5B TaxID=2714927 RepID=UPI00140765EA|nr:tetratricopeptide repeat protein [Dysgonomonas sp. HDW5B]QIK55709.1 tetratricopeptide repeat protein [Dysgonomonas sp. HDW5B]